MERGRPRARAPVSAVAAASAAGAARGARALTGSSRARAGARAGARLDSAGAGSRSHARAAARGSQVRAARGVREHAGARRRRRRCCSPHCISGWTTGHSSSAAVGGHELVAPGRVGAALDEPALDERASRAVSTARGMSRCAWRSVKRRTPKKRSRRISSVQRSPTTSSERASAQVWPS